MSVGRAAVFALRCIALAILLFVSFIVASPVLGPAPELPPAEAAAGAAALLVSCALDALVLGYVFARSRWSGWRLVATTAFVLYGVKTAMAQMESAIFITRLPEGMLPKLFLMGAIVVAIFSPLAVLVMGKIRRRDDDGGPNTRLSMPVGELVWKLAVIAVVYVALYFGFGYFVAWRVPEVRAYYGGPADDPGFAGAILDMVRATPWLPAFQLLRGLMWAALAAPVIRMTKGRWWEAGLAVSLLFSVVMNSQLLLPNPFMPEPVRLAHMIETASSNFVFAWIVVWLLARRPEPAHVLEPA